MTGRIGNPVGNPWTSYIFLLIFVWFIYKFQPRPSRFMVYYFLFTIHSATPSTLLRAEG